MARQVLPIVGAIVGAYFGNPQLGYAIGSIIGNAVDPQVIKGPKIGEAGVQTSAEGVFRPIVYGTAPVKGNIIHRGNRKIRKRREQQGKGGPISETERVHWTFAIRICEGPIAGVTRIWMDEKLVYDITPASTIGAETAKFMEGMRLYLGGEDQLPDPDLEAYIGVGNVNSYRGTAYAVFPNFDLTDYGERIPDFRFEVVARVAIQSSEVMALGAINNSFSRQTAVSTDGYTWPVGVNDAFESHQYILSSGGRVFIHSTLGVHYTDDLGVTWIESEGGASAGGGAVGDTKGDIVILPNGISGMTRSIDKGLTFGTQLYPSVPRSNYIAIGELFTISATIYSTQLSRSIDVGENWAPAGSHGLSFATGGDVTKSDDKFVFGGSNAGGKPAIIWTPDGIAIFEYQVGTTDGNIRALAYGTIADQEVWVAATTGGQLFWSNDLETWTVSTTPLPVNTLIFSNGKFIAGGTFSGDGFIAVSEDGQTFAEVTQPFANNVLDFALVYPQATSDRILLMDIVADLHDRIGHEPDQYNVEALTQLVYGVVLAGDYNSGDAIRTFMPVYMFDSSEHDEGSGYKINYIMRGAPVVTTLTFDDLVEAPEETKREDGLERPRTLHMHFESPTIGYAPAKASPKRNTPDLKVVGERSIQVPVSFQDVDEAWQRADVMLKVVWSEIGGLQKLSLPMQWLALVPTDVIGLSLRQQVHRLRFVRIDFADGIMQCELLADRQSAYTSNLTGIPLPLPTPPLPSIVGPTMAEFLDIPALNDNNDRPLYYLAASGLTEAWYGADVQRSLDAGANYVTATTFTINSIMGVLLEDVSDASEHYTDTTNVLRLELYMEDEVDSLTVQQFLSEGGSLAVETPAGGWEIMQYRDAAEDSNGDLILSTLLRGRLNTETTNHLNGASVVFLETVRSVDAVTAWLGEELTHRAVSFGESPESAIPFTDTYTMQSQREWPVAHLFGEIDGDDLVLSAVPRHRFGTEDHPVQSINHDGYRWTATDGANTISVDTAAPNVTIDVTTWATPITVTVAQLNRFTGAGPTVSEVIE